MKYIALLLGIITLAFTLKDIAFHTEDISIIATGTFSVMLIAYFAFMNWIEEEQSLRDFY